MSMCAHLVSPTKKGNRVVQDIERLNREKMVELFRRVSARERADLLALLKEIEKQFG